MALLIWPAKHSSASKMNKWIFLCLLAVSVSAANLPVEPTIADLRARQALGATESVLVLNGGSFSDNTSNAVIFVRNASSSAATNQTDTLAASPSGRWIVKRISAEPTPFLHTDDRIAAWFNSEAFIITNGLVNGSGLLTNAALRWPDGSGGQYNVTTINTTFGSSDAWTYTHLITGKTFTQAAVQRDSSGTVTNVPLISVSPAGDTFQYPYTNYIGGAGYYVDLNAFRIATNTFTIVLIGADTNGVTGTWIRSGSGTDDGANYWSDATGTQIKRIQ